MEHEKQSLRGPHNLALHWQSKSPCWTQDPTTPSALPADEPAIPTTPLVMPTDELAMPTVPPAMPADEPAVPTASPVTANNQKGTKGCEYPNWTEIHPSHLVAYVGHVPLSLGNLRWHHHSHSSSRRRVQCHQIKEQLSGDQGGSSPASSWGYPRQECWVVEDTDPESSGAWQKMPPPGFKEMMSTEVHQDEMIGNIYEHSDGLHEADKFGDSPHGGWLPDAYPGRCHQYRNGRYLP